ncbi:helicase-associated domain-containing protein [Streptomyces sp. NPDC005065]|uniref:helicase-associated domain-containing protein n=1 Tax=unclassified Streptomyces TaxID=2593676 RepID=UPI0033BC6D94
MTDRTTAKAPDAFDAIDRPTEHAAQADLRAVLQLCAAGKLRCSAKTLRPAAATVAVVAEVLTGGDFYPHEPVAAYAWPLLLQAGGLAELSGSKLQLTVRGRTALTKPAHDTIRLLWQKWITRGVIDEFSRCEEIKGQRAANVLTAVKPRRQAVAATLARAAEGEWEEADAFFDRVRSSGNGFAIARSERAQWRLYLVDAEYGSMGYAGYGDWPLLQGRYTLAVLFEYAATLGLIDVRHTAPAGARADYHDQWGADDLDYLTRYDGLLALRLNPLGAYATGAAGTYIPSPRTPDSSDGRRIKVLGNFDVVAPDGLPAADELLLSAYAEHTADRVWQLDSRSLLAALDAGRTLRELREFLTSRSDHTLPDTVAVLLADVEARAGKLTDLGPLHLVECADHALALLLVGDRTLRRLCTPLGERHLAVRPDDLPAFRKAVQALGYVLPN